MPGADRPAASRRSRRRAGIPVIDRVARKILYGVLSRRTWSLLKFDLMRLVARCKRGGRRGLQPSHDRLHFGCGRRRVPGWLNVDVRGSEYDVDLASGRLPWRDGVFQAIASQQVIEHLELYDELIPLLQELHRVAAPGAEIWLACPDMEQVCRSYLEHRGADLVEDRRQRIPHFTMHGAPSQQIVNVLFHQGAEHKNLFDFDLLRWALQQSGFTECRRVREADFNVRFPAFPVRSDDYCSLYVTARA